MTDSRHVYSATIVQQLPQPDTEVFYETFDVSPYTTWSGTNAEEAWLIVGDEAHTPPHVLANSQSNGVSGSSLWRTVTGLVVGKSYTLTAWARTRRRPDQAFDRAFLVSIGVTGRAASGVKSQSSADGWAQHAVTFTATATSHVIVLSVAAATGVASGEMIWWDDLRITTPSPNATITTALLIKSGSLTLDEGWAPYAKAQITIPRPATDVFEAIDPRSNPRMKITARQYFADSLGNNYNAVGSLPDQLHTFDLVIRSRELNHAAAEVTLTLSSDEALLQDYGLVASASRASSTTSAVTAVREALAIIGTAPTISATLTDKPTITRTNFCANPSFAVNTTGWSTQLATIARSTAWSAYGAGSLQITPTTSGNPDSCAIYELAVLPAGRTFTISATIRLTAPQTGVLFGDGRERAIALVGNPGSGVAVVARSNQAPNAAGEYRVSVTYTIPNGWTGNLSVRLYNGAALGGGTVWYDGVLWEETNENRPYFDGATVNTLEQITAWTGSANGSASSAVVRAHVNAQASQWEPGQSAWEWLKNLLSASGLRLFCDEFRIWRLVDASYTVNAVTRVAEGYNVTQSADRIDRDRTLEGGGWYDAVVIKWTWDDANGDAQTYYETASIPGFTKPSKMEINKPFPGPGTAAYILNRAQGRGRTLSLKALSDYTVIPSGEVVATLSGTPIQTGQVTSVTWSITDDEMSIETRGLIDTPLGAWVLAPEDLTWDSVPSATTWANYTP